MKAIERTGIDYYCQVSDVELIKEIVNGLSDFPLCVNIGAGMGTSSLAMLEARQDSYVLSLDIKDGEEEREVIENAGFLNRYRFVEGRSQDIGEKAYHYGEVDFVFIDGGHSYDECKTDAIIWYDVLKNGGIMAFHDYESPIIALDSVKKAVDDVSKILKLKFVTRKGTLIVFKKVI